MTKKEQQRINKLLQELESFAQYQLENAKNTADPSMYEGVAYGIRHALGCFEELKTIEKG